MSESPYDAFGGGHSSISISAVLGMAMLRNWKGIISVIMLPLLAMEL